MACGSAHTAISHFPLPAACGEPLASPCADPAPRAQREKAAATTFAACRLQDAPVMGLGARPSLRAFTAPFFVLAARLVAGGIASATLVAGVVSLVRGASVVLGAGLTGWCRRLIGRHAGHVVGQSEDVEGRACAPITVFLVRFGIDVDAQPSGTAGGDDRDVLL